MKIRAGGGSFRARGGALGQQGAPPCYSSLWETLYKLWSCQKMCDALHYLLDNTLIRFGSKLYRQIVGIPMGTNCAPL